MKKKLSVSGKNRLIRQSRNLINRLTVRMTTCDMRDLYKVLAALQAERVALSKLEAQ